MNASTGKRNFFCLNVTGLSKDINRQILRTEFQRYGKVEKLYLESTGKFARIFYQEKESCELAIQGLNGGSEGWQVEYHNLKPVDNRINHFASSSEEISNMAGYRNYYDDDEDFSENFDYCNVHGQPLTVLQADSGDLYVNIKDIRKTGFVIFRRDTFNSILMDKRQIGKEFELHLLSEAKNYILKNRAVIHEEEILKTIERCKNKLLGANSSENRSNFGPGRSIAPASRNNITITAEVHNQQPESVNNFAVPHQRPPRASLGNLAPRANYERSKSTTREQQPRNNERDSARNTSYDSTRNNRESRHSRNASQSSFLNGSDDGRPKKESPGTNLNDGSTSDSTVGSRSSRPDYNNTNRERKPPRRNSYEKIKLEIGQTYEVQVVHREEKENVCWVQRKEDVAKMDELLLQINEAEEDLECINPEVDQLVIAQFEEVWCRGWVTRTDPLTVHFIDYGNKSMVDSVKPLPDVFKKLPGKAVRIVVGKEFELNSEMSEINILVVQEYEDLFGTFLVRLVESARPKVESKAASIKLIETEKSAEPRKREKSVEPREREKSVETRKREKSVELRKTEPPRETFYFDAPKPITELKNDDKVMLIDVDENKFLVRTKDCAQKCKDITDYIKSLSEAPLTLTNVKVGQLVLCYKDGMPDLYRAVVTKKETGSLVTLRYIDFSGEVDLSVKSLRNVDDFLAKEPSALIYTPEFMALADANEEMLEFISQLFQNKEKFTVKMSGGKFDLLRSDGTLLSEKLKDIKSPKKHEKHESTTVKLVPEPKKERKADVKKETPKASNVIMYNDMEWIDIKPGSHSFLCYRFDDLDDVTMIGSTEDIIIHFEAITGLEVEDNVPYKPEELEMCLVLFKGPDDDEANWFRATVLSVEDDGYEVVFIDFGNQEKVKRSDVRKFPSNLKAIPMLGINCELIGIPHKPEIVKHLKELLPEGEQVDVIVKGLGANGHHKYQIEIPSLYKALKVEGLY